MRLSEKTQMVLYSAIDNEVIDLRIKHKKSEINNLDTELYHLVLNIWKKQKQILNIDD